MPESLFQSFDVVADNILKMGQILVQPICKSQQGQYLYKIETQLSFRSTFLKHMQASDC